MPPLQGGSSIFLIPLSILPALCGCVVFLALSGVQPVFSNPSAGVTGVEETCSGPMATQQGLYHPQRCLPRASFGLLFWFDFEGGVLHSPVFHLSVLGQPHLQVSSTVGHKLQRAVPSLINFILHCISFLETGSLYSCLIWNSLGNSSWTLTPSYPPASAVDYAEKQNIICAWLF